MEDEYLSLRRFLDGPPHENPLLMGAIKILFTRRDADTSEMDSIDYKGCKERLMDFMAGRDWEELEYQELCEVEGLVRPIGIYEECREDLKEIDYQLQAIYCFVSEMDRHMVLSAVKNAPYKDQHEVLTRWMWISEQDKQILKKKKFNWPYLCWVGNNIWRKTIDREFHSCLKLLNYLSSENDSEYFLYEKQEGPDFLIVDRKNNVIGLEITEALPAKGSVLERKKEEELLKKLRVDFSNAKVCVSFQTRPPWSVLLENYLEFRSWLEAHLPIKENIPWIASQKLKVSVGLFVSKGIHFSDCSGDGSGLPVFGEKTEEIVSKVIVQAIKEKLDKNYKKPCFLGVYENAGQFAINFSGVIQRCKMDDAIRTQKKFDQIWIVTDQRSYLLSKLEES